MRTGLAALLALTISPGCVAPAAARRPAPAVHLPARPPAPPSQPGRGLESVMGRDARTVAALLGNPALDVREGRARKLQFGGPACVLDLYLYPPQNGGEPVVTHVDARFPDGRDTDRAACIGALSRR